MIDEEYIEKKAIDTLNNVKYNDSADYIDVI